MYVLREAFDYPHREIAEILDITEAASQQIFHRAKEHVAHAEARPDIDKAAAQRIVEEFLAAATSGQTDELVRLLTKDAIAIGDGGGKVPARTKAFEGAVAVAKFVWGMFKPAEAKRAIVGGSPEIYAWTANGEPAVVAVVEGRVVAIMCLEVTAEGITACRTQANPDKLERATEPMGGGRPRGTPARDVTRITCGSCQEIGGPSGSSDESEPNRS